MRQKIHFRKNTTHLMKDKITRVMFKNTIELTGFSNSMNSKLAHFKHMDF